MQYIKKIIMKKPFNLHHSHEKTHKTPFKDNNIEQSFFIDWCRINACNITPEFIPREEWQIIYYKEAIKTS